MGETQDTEITLGTGKLLIIFFGLVVFGAVFFTMGYMLGRGSAAGGSSTEIVSSVPSNAAGKPQAANKTSDAANQGSSASTSAQAAPVPVAGTKPPTTPTSAPAATTPDATDNSASDNKGSFLVQVAAVSRKEDADNLKNALEKKQYPVFVSNVPGDSFFHVQVGPFTDRKEAESMRARLVGEGYAAIVK